MLMPVSYATLQVQQQSAIPWCAVSKHRSGTNIALHADQAEVSRISPHLQSANGAPEDVEMDSETCARLQRELTAYVAAVPCCLEAWVPSPAVCFVSERRRAYA